MGRGRKVLGAFAAAPFVLAGAAGARYALAAGKARRDGRELEPGVPTPEPTARLAGSVALDTLITLPIGLLSSTGSAEHYARSSAELDEAVRFYGDAGWLDDPGSRHPEPTDVPAMQVSTRRDRHGLETARFDSGWAPVDGEPGGQRWAGFSDNRTVTVRLMRHEGAPRPWLVAVHGQGMGRAGDHRMLRVRHLHEELGVNVALPVLPLHGPRAAGFSSDEMFVSNVYPVNNVLGVTQAVWDLRRLLSWLRTEQVAPAVGALGMSLGSYLVSMLSTVVPDLACVVALVPQPDLAGSLRAADPLVPSKRRLHRDLYDERVDLVHRPVSPLAAFCAVPHDRRFIVAGQADRVAAPSGAARLWHHWDEPSIMWRPRGHVTTGRSSPYDDHLTSALTTSGLVADPSAHTQER